MPIIRDKRKRETFSFRFSVTLTVGTFHFWYRRAKEVAIHFVILVFFSQFVHINNLKLICRAHQLVHEGYKYMFDETLVTVWSAPNYCYRCGNIASILAFSDADTREPKLFKAVPDCDRVIPPRTTTPYFL